MFVCVGALAVLDRLDEIDQERLAFWLAERQLPNGGLNGRPEKLEDVGSNPYSTLIRLPDFWLRFVTASGSFPPCQF